MRELGVRVLRRVLLAGTSLALVVTASIVLMRLSPGRFGDELRLDAAIGNETRVAVERRTAPGATISEDAIRWTGGLLRGDLGRSLASGLPVGQLLRDRIVDTLVLTVPATLLAWSVALLWVGRLAVARGRVLPLVSNAALAAGQSVPDVVLGLVLVWLALETGWWPVGGQGEWERAAGWTAGVELARHAILPVLGLASLMLPVLVRHLHAAVGEAARSPFVRAARARGLTPQQLYWRYQLRSALSVVAPLVGSSLSALLGGALVFEIVFAWPGLGPLLVDAVLARDVPVVLGTVSASAALLVVSHAISDVLQYAADPRLRL